MPACNACDGTGNDTCSPSVADNCQVCHGTGRRRWREVAADLRDEAVLWEANFHTADRVIADMRAQLAAKPLPMFKVAVSQDCVSKVWQAYLVGPIGKRYYLGIRFPGNDWSGFTSYLCNCFGCSLGDLDYTSLEGGSAPQVPEDGLADIAAGRETMAALKMQLHAAVTGCRDERAARERAEQVASDLGIELDHAIATREAAIRATRQAKDERDDARTQHEAEKAAHERTVDALQALEMRRSSETKALQEAHRDVEDRLRVQVERCVDYGNRNASLNAVIDRAMDTLRRLRWSERITYEQVVAQDECDALLARYDDADGEER